MSVTAKMVKELRDITSAGMMDCKTALVESDGDIQAAVDWLRRKGKSSAAKKSGRVAANGLIAVAVTDDQRHGALVEVNTETDFVARNSKFQKAVAKISRLALEANGSTGALLALPYPDGSGSVSDKISDLVGAIGENITVRRTVDISVESGIIGSYIHAAETPGMGQKGVLVALNIEAGEAGEARNAQNSEELRQLAKHLAMQVVAASPQFISAQDIPADILERERAVLFDQAQQSGKPAAAIKKIVEGRLQKFRKENALLSQEFMIESPFAEKKATVADVLEKVAAYIGAKISIKGLVNFVVGEGIQQDKSDFAAEIAEMTRS